MRKNKNNETDLPLTISSKDGLVDQVTFFNKTVASKDMSGYYLLKKGEYAYNKSYSVGYDFGSIKRLERYPMGALSTLYICFALTKYNSDYIKTYFDSLKWYKEIYMISAEGARNHGLLNVPTDELFSTYHYITENIKEQEKIARLMELIESRIQKQQSLVDKLKKYKRGLLQAVFNQKIRLTKSEENWQIYRIGDLLKICHGKDYKNISSQQKTYPVLGTGGVIDYVDEYICNWPCVLIGRKGTINKPQYMETPFWSVDTLFYSKPNKNQHPKFQFYLFQTINWQKYNEASGVPSLSSSTIEGIKVNVPNYETQAEINNIFSFVDCRIESTEKSLNNLLLLKKALLQQLFI